MCWYFIVYRRAFGGSRKSRKGIRALEKKLGSKSFPDIVVIYAFTRHWIIIIKGRNVPFQWNCWHITKGSALALLELQPACLSYCESRSCSRWTPSSQGHVHNKCFPACFRVKIVRLCGGEVQAAGCCTIDKDRTFEIMPVHAPLHTHLNASFWFGCFRTVLMGPWPFVFWVGVELYFKNILK